jgi:hypothetical protein
LNIDEGIIHADEQINKPLTLNPFIFVAKFGIYEE